MEEHWPLQDASPCQMQLIPSLENLLGIASGAKDHEHVLCFETRCHACRGGWGCG